jgi:diketogulonate reductase-like aldo/keto reductase
LTIPAQVAITWVRYQQRRVPIIPILGAHTAAQLRENLSCLDVTLTPGHQQRLADASPCDLGFPHAFLRLPHLEELIYSGMLPRLDLQR